MTEEGNWWTDLGYDTEAQAQSKYESLDARVHSTGIPDINNVLTDVELQEYTRLQDKFNPAASNLVDGKQPCEGILADFNLPDTLKNIGKGIVDGISNLITAAIDQAKAIANQVIGLVTDTIELIKDTITDAVDSARKFAKDPGAILRKIGAGIADTIKNIEDEIMNQLNKLRCVEDHIDNVSDIKGTSTVNIASNLRAKSPKRRKLIDTSPIDRSDFITEQKQKTIDAVAAKKTTEVHRTIAKNNGSEENAIASIEATKVKTTYTPPKSGSSAPVSVTRVTTPSSPVIPTSQLSDAPVLVSVEYNYSTYALSTGETVKAIFGSRGNVIYTDPESAISNFTRS
jgi:hypothetical protein